MSCYFCVNFRKDNKFYTIWMNTIFTRLQRIRVSVKGHYEVMASHLSLLDVYYACVL